MALRTWLMMLLEQMGDANIRGDYGCPQLFTPILRGVPARPVAATAAHRLPEVLSMNSVHLTCCIHGKHTRLLFRCRESTSSLNWHVGLAASLVPIFIFSYRFWGFAGFARFRHSSRDKTWPRKSFTVYLSKTKSTVV